MLRVRLDGNMDNEEAVVRKNFHEAGRLYDSLRNYNLSSGSGQSADESSFGEHDEVCMLLLLFGYVKIMSAEFGPSERVLSKRIEIDRKWVGVLKSDWWSNAKREKDTCG